MASVSIEEYWIKARCQALKCESRLTTSFTYSSTETLLSLYFTHPHLSIVAECYEAIGSLRSRIASLEERCQHAKASLAKSLEARGKKEFEPSLPPRNHHIPQSVNPQS